MPYISFNNSPIEENNNQPIKYRCDNCIHKLFATNDLCRCSFNNNLMFKDTVFKTACDYKDCKPSAHRLVILGLFSYNNEGNIIWLGGMTVCGTDGIDQEIFSYGEKRERNQLIKDLGKELYASSFYCIVAERKQFENFNIKTDLIDKTILNNAINQVIAHFNADNSPKGGLY